MKTFLIIKCTYSSPLSSCDWHDISIETKAKERRHNEKRKTTVRKTAVHGRWSDDRMVDKDETEQPSGLEGKGRRGGWAKGMYQWPEYVALEGTISEHLLLIMCLARQFLYCNRRLALLPFPYPRALSALSSFSASLYNFMYIKSANI